MSDGRDLHRELRTDWLKLRGCLVDPVTRLPSLPLVLDRVRCRLEAGEEVGLIYVDPSHGGHLESTHGWQAYDHLIRDVAEALGRSLGGAGKDVLALVRVRSDEFVMFPRLAGPGLAGPGLDGPGLAGGAQPGERLEQLHAKVIEEVQEALARRRDAPFTVALRSAAVELATEPTMRIERSIYEGLQHARERCRQESERGRAVRLAELRRILGEHDVEIRYQPIVELGSGRIHGLEALSMPPASAVFESSDVLFSFAEETDHVLELDRLCRRAAMSHSLTLVGPRGVAAGSKLFLNSSAQVFHDQTLLADLLEGVRTAGLEPGTLVLEVTERVAITEWQAVRECLDTLRQAGVRVAIDDMGSGYSSLHAVAEIEPDYLKFDLSLVTDVHLSPIKREMLATLVTLARKIGARQIAEGIEKLEEFETVRAMGIDYGQGFFFAHPAVATEVGRIHFPLRS